MEHARRGDADHLPVHRLAEWMGGEILASEVARAAFFLADSRIAALRVFWVFFPPEEDGQAVTLDTDEGFEALRLGKWVDGEGRVYEGVEVAAGLFPYFAVVDDLLEVLR